MVAMKTQGFQKNGIGIIFLLAIVPPLGRHVGASVDDAASKPRTQNTIMVWDTGLRSAEPLTPAMLAAKQGGNPISAPETLSSFKGDAVVSNGRIAAVVRHQSPAVEVYAE